VLGKGQTECNTDECVDSDLVNLSVDTSPIQKLGNKIFL